MRFTQLFMPYPLRDFMDRAARRGRLFRHLLRRSGTRLMHHKLRGEKTIKPGAAPVARDAERRRLARLDLAELFARFNSRETGLTIEETLVLRETFGLNEIEHDKPLVWYAHLWLCYRNPFNVLLTVLALVSAMTGDAQAALLIAIMVAMSTLLRFAQERRSSNAARALRAMVSTTAAVLRPGTPAPVETPLAELVPGDVVVLAAGDMIPADVRFLRAKDVFVSQATLTGESLPVRKEAVLASPAAPLGDSAVASSFECENLGFMGTSVVSGAGSALVLATGNQTCFGELAGRVMTDEQPPTAFQEGVAKVSWLLIRFMLVMAPLVLLLNGSVTGDWLSASLFALSIAVGLTPEMLPMIVTSTLAKGALLLSRRKVIVKRLDAIQNLGAMTVLCTDKTGTLTEDRVALERYVTPDGETDNRVFELAWLNSRHQTGLRNLLDAAVLEHGGEPEMAATYAKVDEIPFDFVRRRMSVVVRREGEAPLMICKGALEEMLGVSTMVRTHGTVHPLDDAGRAALRTRGEELGREGLRVVAVAARPITTEKADYTVDDERDFVLHGLLAFLDPPKASAAPALAALQRSGVRVNILTGDADRVALKVCREVGLAVTGVITGPEIDALTDEVLAVNAASANVFARLSPLQKERLVRVLRRDGHIVGFMGDGINDAPALHAADVGISVDTAADIAKEAADIILLEKSLMVLEEGVLEGRRTFANMLKYIRMTASSNFGNVFSVLAASAFLPFLPMLPLQLLVQNLLYDLAQTAVPFDKVDDESIAAPLRWNPDALGRFMIWFGPVSSLFDILTFVLMWRVFGADSAASQSLFHAGWFVEGLLSQTLIVHMIRTRKIPFVQSVAGWPLLLMTALVMAVGIWLPLGPFAHAFKFATLPEAYFGWLAALLLGYMVLTQVVKTLYIKRYGWQ